MVQETQFTSCNKTITVRAISGWLKALLHHVITGIQFTLRWIQNSLNVNSFSHKERGGFIFGDRIPAEFLHLPEQLPTLACNVLRPGRGHMLPPSVTGGTWPADVSYGHVRCEKGVGFIVGGDIPTNISTTAWQFMGQEIPQNYGKLVFGFPLTLEVDFDPANESVHGLLAGSSQEREAPAQDDQPMQTPHEQPSRRPGSSLQREEPESQWEQQRSSSRSSEPPEQEEVPIDDQPEQEATPTNVQDDPMGEEVVDLWGKQKTHQMMRIM